MILSNISVPLLGLVDTAVIGHLSHAHYLAGIALGSGSIALLFWLASFLRMSTTGEIAQAYGEQNQTRALQSLFASLMLALTFAVTLVALSPFLLQVIAQLANPTEQVMTQAHIYFSTRIYSAPAAMMNLVLLGFMLGLQYGRGPFYVVLFTNLVNIVLDLVFVIGFEWGVAGAAWASVIADYSALILACVLTAKLLRRKGWQLAILLPSRPQITHLLSLNKDIFIRSLVLQLCFSFMTFYGARLGENTLAANAVLLNFLMLVSFALDGIAYAAEAKVGQAKGEQDVTKLKAWVRVSVFWGGIFALLYCVIFAAFGRLIITSLTSIESVIITATHYLPWLVILPIIAMSCFLFDGVFVGLTRAREMRNSMLFSALCGFFLPFLIMKDLGNHALWLAMTCFMALRGVTLIYRYRKLDAQQALLK
ncbi:MATE family efflux transporter DinF [Pseudoalteromonas sp. SMS1]|uniref:MATE family efflux transporter DinF n=1 Tax=Pseudoalteromonas sp. SMS1 TaxID=2908894 RepID=UPI001F1E825F|nr:MATE family efflux transporter DinF [Pseudoalteromonas sp. SMS1]MCF2859616.1 MATE family efflux transporter DinF [Pseudoalteromonas sp. SMS1]